MLRKEQITLIKLALKEDIGKGDITTGILISPNIKVRAVIIAKEQGIIAGFPIAQAVFKCMDAKVKFKPLIQEGAWVKKEQKIAELEGKARNILIAERTALNFLGKLSGIATLTHQFVKKVKPYKVKIMDTRKTTPGLRELEKYAVGIGGGYNHRRGLWDQVLIKDNHLKVLTSYKQSISGIIKKTRQKLPPSIKLEIEVKNLKELEQALWAKPDIIMLDNMSPQNVQRAVKMRNRVGKRPVLEVSGGITLNNVWAYARAGVEMISIGALTHSAQALDLSLKIVQISQ